MRIVYSLIALSGCLAASAAADTGGSSAGINAKGGPVSPAMALIVSNTNDSGAGSLRQALNDANATPGPNLITFDIPGNSVHTIAPLSALGASDPVIIDGYSQPGSSPNTLSNGNNAVLRIELNGIFTPANGLTILTSNCTVRGLVINRFSGSGLWLQGGNSNVIEGNFIGTDPSGTDDTGAFGNSGFGILVAADSSFNLIGGTAPGARNVISGNAERQGILLSGSGNRVEGNFIGTDRTGTVGIGNDVGVAMGGASNVIGGTLPGAGNLISGNLFGGISIGGPGHRVQGNLIGTDITGLGPLGNVNYGLAVGGSGGTVIGGTNSGAGNTIAFNSSHGVYVSGSSLPVGQAILGNSIFSNQGLGIKLQGGGGSEALPTPNDPGDADTGPNNLQNFPIMSRAFTGNSTTFEGALNSTPNTSFRLEFFASAVADPSEHGEGEIFVGATNVVTDGAGNVVFSLTFPMTIASGYSVTATATDPAGNTSEFSPAVQVNVPSITAFSPTSGPVGSTVFITGAHFDPVPTNNIVYFGGVRATVLIASSSALTVLVPAGATYHPISVTRSDGAMAFSPLPFVVTFPSNGFLDANSFATKVDFAVGAGPHDLLTFDVDIDGRLDLVTETCFDCLAFAVFRNLIVTPDITVNSMARSYHAAATTQIIGRFVTLAKGDLDGDGNLDMVIANTGTNRITIVPNISTPANPQFSAKFDLVTGQQAHGVAIGDLDGDGKPDVVAANFAENTISVLRNLSSPGNFGSGTFSSKVDFAAGSNPIRVAIGDLDGDGKPDVIASNFGTNTLSVWRNTSTPGVNSISLALPVQLTVGKAPVGLGLGDLDGDGKLDLVAVNNNDDGGAAVGSISILRNTATAGLLDANSFAAKVDVVVGRSPISVAVGDLDGDGRPDLAVANNNGQPGGSPEGPYMGLSVLQNHTTIGTIISDSWGRRLDFFTGGDPTGVAIGDLSGDGKPEVMIANGSSLTLSVFQNQAASPGTPVILVDGQHYPSNTLTVGHSTVISLETGYSDGTILYTLDGSDPAVAPLVYTAPFQVSASVTIRAFAYNAIGLASDEAGPFVLTVLVGPSIVIGPQTQTVIAGENVTFSVQANGTPPLSYQWLTNGVPRAGATASTLLLSNVSTNQAGIYRVQVDNAYGMVLSAPASLTVLTAPAILAHPTDTNTTVGGTVTFRVEVFGVPPPQFQWRKNGVNLPGATNDTLVLSNVQVSDGGTYTVIVASEAGVVVAGPAVLTVVVSVVQPNDLFANRVPLTGSTNVVSGTNTAATSEQDEPDHAGQPPRASVWYTWTAPTNGIARFRTVGSTFDTLLAIYTGTSVNNLTPVAQDDDLGGFLSSSLVFNATNAVAYQIAVDGFGGASGAFVLAWELEPTMARVPEILVPPESQTVGDGEPAEFNVVARDPTGLSLSYQWLFNGVEIGGATDTDYMLASVLATNVGRYTVRVSNGVNSVTSAPAVLEIGPVSTVQSTDKLEDQAPGGGGQRAFNAGANATPASTSVPFISPVLGQITYQVMTGSDNNGRRPDCPSVTVADCDGVEFVGVRWLPNFRVPANGTLIVSVTNNGSPKFLSVDRGGATTLSAQCRIGCSSSVYPVTETAPTFYTFGVHSTDSADTTNRLDWVFARPPEILTNGWATYCEAALGETLTLHVTVTNHIDTNLFLPTNAHMRIPEPTYRWFHKVGDQYHPLPSATASTLVLSELQPADAGEYRVEVNNLVGSVATNVSVGVGSAPLVAVATPNQCLPIGSSLELNVTVADRAQVGLVDFNPLATYRWLFNGDAAGLEGEQQSRLFLSDLQLINSGIYTLVASNRFGIASHSVQVDIGTCDLDLQSMIMAGNSLCLTWQLVSGGRPMVQFKDSLDPEEPWKPVTSGLEIQGTRAQLKQTLTEAGQRFYRIVIQP